RLAGRQQFFHLCAFDGPLENHAAGAKIASLIGPHRLFADIGLGELEHARTALRTRTKRRLVAPIGCLRFVAAIALAEIEGDLVRVGKLDRGRERPTEAAPEALERADMPIAQQGLGFGRLELTPAHDLPEPELAGLALEFLVVLVHLAAAFRAG